MPKRPNILWLMTDEHRTDSLGCYGSPWASTPHLDALAARGTRFGAAYTPSPVCVAARASILTGRACSRIGVLNNHQKLPDEYAHFLTRCFAQAGYQTAGFGKQHYNHPSAAFDTQVMRVLDDCVDYAHYGEGIDSVDLGALNYPKSAGHYAWILAGRYPGSIDETPEALNVADAIDWLSSRDRDRPFLLRVSQNAPHTPVVAPEPYDTMIDPASIHIDMDPSGAAGDLPAPVRDGLMSRAGAHRLDEAGLRRAQQCYYGRVAFADELFGKLLAALDAAGELDNTIIAFISDHGTHLGDHGLMQKQSFFEESARVPFVLAGPGVPRDQVINRPVSIASLLPTLAAMCDVQVDCPVDWPALSCRDDVAADAVVSEIDYGLWDYRPGDRYVMVRRDQWKLMTYRATPGGAALSGDAAMCLYDLASDPQERHDLSGKPECQPVIARLLAELDGWDRSNAGR